jgi:uncharacterized protein YciI
MKGILLLFQAAILCLSLSAQTENPDYDHELAKALEADEFGMKSYVFVLLKTGTRVEENTEIRDSLFAGHLNNIGRMADLGKLVIAGPLGQNDRSYRGIFVLNVKTFEEAEELLKTDPAISENLLEAELYKWYGSAAIGEYLKVHKKIVKQEF